MAKNDITVKVLGDASGFRGALNTAQTSLGSFSRVAGLAGVAVGAGIVAAGVGLAKLGEKFDGAYDAIQTQTGATGEALAGLTSSFDDVLASGPSSFEDVAAAVGGLNQRLGLTGQPLEDLSTQLLDLSRITGTDVAANVESATRVFGDWGIAAEDQTAAMDELFRASQATGVEVGTLADGMVTFGGPMRQLGFSFEETAALMGGFEAQGVNTELVMGSLRIALGKFAKEGEDAPEALARVTEEIAGMDEAAGNARAIELFGARAGPDMAAAIREGRFEIDDYLEVIENGESTISGTADATDDWREKLATLKNKILVKLAPLAEKVFSAITDGLVAAMPYLEAFGEWVGKKGEEVVAWFKENWPDIKAAIAAVVTWLRDVGFPAIRQVFDAITRVAAVVVQWAVEHWPQFKAAIKTAFDWLVNDAWPVVRTVFNALRIAAEATVSFFITHWPTIRTVLAAVFDWLVGTAYPAVRAVLLGIINGAKQVVAWFTRNWDNIADIVEEVVGTVQDIVEGIVEFVGDVVDGIRDLIDGDWSAAWNKLKEIINTVWNGIKFLVQAAVDVLKRIIPMAWDVIKFVSVVAWNAIKAAIALAWEGIKFVARAGVDWIKATLITAWDRVKATATAVWGLIKTAIFQAWEGIKLVAQAAVDWIKAKLLGAWNTIKTTAWSQWGNIKETISSAWEGIKSLAKTGVDAVVLYIASLPGRLAGYAWSFVQAGANLGASIVNGFVSALSGLGQSIYNAFRNAINIVIGAWNGLEFTVGGGSFLGIGIPSFTLGTPNVPYLHSGGWVDGRNGADVPTILQAGEYVSSRDELNGNPRRDSPYANRGPATVNINHYGQTMTPGAGAQMIEMARRS